jgi:hypothetical protein
VAARGERDLIRGALLDDGHVPQGPLQGGLYARPRRGYHLVCGGLSAAAVAGGLALGTGDRGGELAAVLQLHEVPPANR